MATISPETALIYVMVTMSAVDSTMNDTELRAIGDVVKQLPVFQDFETDRLLHVARECGSILQEDEGLDTIFGLVKEALPLHLRETAYALGVEIASSDLAISEEELRLLQLLRDALDIEKLAAAAIERSAQARFMTL